MTFLEWDNDYFGTYDVFLIATRRDMNMLASHFQGEDMYSTSFNGQEFYYLLDSREKIITPMWRYEYAFGGQYDGYPPYGDELPNFRFNVSEYRYRMCTLADKGDPEEILEQRDMQRKHLFHSKYAGCLVGGAVGDALGYPVEFDTIESIRRKYGSAGIRDYELHHGKARISDDTQMTLYTANGLLFAVTRGCTYGVGGHPFNYMWMSYQDWLNTQNAHGVPSLSKISWLNNLPDMNHARAPGNTCLSALEDGKPGRLEEPINRSKGCGGVMRVAPIGLYLPGSKHYRMTQAEIDRIGAEAAALTHGNTLGWLPAAALVHIISLAVHSQLSLPEIIEDTRKALLEEFPDTKHVHRFAALLGRAAELAASDMDDVAAIADLGSGFCGDEALAIAVYCAMKYERSFEEGVIAAVNHSGDSDSTGAITGNILGAYLGLDAIPERLLEPLELRETITEIAEDLYSDCQIDEFYEHTYEEAVWESKYIYHCYPKIREI